MACMRAHPRVGGENGTCSGSRPGVPGSSPRGRGKHALAVARLDSAGLIPAWAGKTAPRSPRSRLAPAHPRVGGENANRDNKYQLQKGSSPRGRGKLVPCAGIPGVAGLIPAWAGKTFGEATEMHASWAHPRVGGENSRASVGTLLGTGSSPRGRGKRSRAWSPPPTPGLIPAWAGKTTRGQACTWRERAHPRVGGENM